MFRENCEVIAHQKIGPSHWVLKLRSPRIAANAKPGQFVQLLCADTFDPLLPRPFSFLTADAKDFSLLYQVAGKGTRLLSGAKKGDAFWVLGPLGNGFGLAGKPSGESILVGGGVGIPPLYHFAQTLKAKTTHVLLGARNKELLLCEKDFKKLGVDLRVATDDGSKGRKGLVTELLIDLLKKNKNGRIYTCGPTPMLKAVQAVAKKYATPCEISVEVPMACGFGVCLGCAVKVKDRFALACTEGPVFSGSELQWQ